MVLTIIQNPPENTTFVLEARESGPRMKEFKELRYASHSTVSYREKKRDRMKLKQNENLLPEKFGWMRMVLKIELEEGILTGSHSPDDKEKNAGF